MFDFAILADPGYHDRLKEMDAQVQASTELQNVVITAAALLIEISKADGDMTENRESFLEPELAKQVAEIGEVLNEAGGFLLMQYVAEFSATKFRHPSDMRMLEFAWDGIGDWRC